jgi:hypothetical protein
LTSKTYEEAISELEARKSKNLEDIDEIAKYSPFVINGKCACFVMHNQDGDIISCLCGKCLNKIPRSPVYNSKFVYPLCQDCILDIQHIENTERKNVKMKSESKKSTIDQVNFDWDGFEKMINEGTAKLVKLAEENNIYPKDLKSAIISRYGSQVSFKKGRNGGIIWSTKTIG